MFFSVSRILNALGLLALISESCCGMGVPEGVWSGAGKSTETSIINPPKLHSIPSTSQTQIKNIYSEIGPVSDVHQYLGRHVEDWNDLEKGSLALKATDDTGITVKRPGTFHPIDKSLSRSEADAAIFGWFLTMNMFITMFMIFHQLDSESHSLFRKGMMFINGMSLAGGLFLPIWQFQVTKNLWSSSHIGSWKWRGRNYLRRLG